MKGRGTRGPSEWERWTATRAWASRAAAWDAEQDRADQAEFLRARKQALREQTTAYRFAPTRGIQALRGIQAAGGMEAVGASAAVHLLEVGGTGLGRVYGRLPDTTVEVAAAPGGADREMARLRIEALLQQLPPLPGGAQEPFQPWTVLITGVPSSASACPRPGSAPQDPADQGRGPRSPAAASTRSSGCHGGRSRWLPSGRVH